MNAQLRLLRQVLVLLVVAVLTVDAAFGQYRDEPPRSAEEAQQRFRRAEFFLAELDANHNGVLEADECTGRRQYFVERMLQRAGLPVHYPVAMDRVREGLQRYYTNAVQAAAPGGTPPGGPPSGPWGGGPPGGPWGGGPPGGPWGGGPPGGGPPGTGGPPGAPSGSSSTPSVAPAVPGFGVAPAAPVVPGFGPVAATTSGPVGASVGGSGGGSTSSQGDDQRYRDYAKQLFGQYDKNRNGVLEKDEYHEMSNNPKAADKNGDGVISFDELFTWLVEMSKSGSHSGNSSGGDNRGRERERERERSKKEEPKQPVYRVPVPSPIDRLPRGLPEWFLKKDIDRDGQVSMAEFSQEWNESKLAEYFKYDINGDGFIVPTEVLRSDKDKATSSSGPSGTRTTTSSSGSSAGNSGSSSSSSGSSGSSEHRGESRWGRSDRGEPFRGPDRGGSDRGSPERGGPPERERGR